MRFSVFSVLAVFAITGCNNVVDPDSEKTSTVQSADVSAFPAAGTNGQLQYNSNGYLAADSALSFDEASHSLVMGSNSAAYQGARAIGAETTASGAESTSIGYSNKTLQTFSIAIGAFNTSKGAASVAIGELLTASGDNAVALGYSTQATGTYSVALGVSNGATATGAFACGIRSWAQRPGEFAHSSGTYGAVGLRAIDVAANSDGGPVMLVDMQGNELALSGASVNSMRIRFSSTTLDGTNKYAHEVREALISVTSAYFATVESNEHVAGNFEAMGYTINLSGGQNVFHIQVNPNGVKTRFLARVEWSDMGGVYH